MLWTRSRRTESVTVHLVGAFRRVVALQASRKTEAVCIFRSLFHSELFWAGSRSILLFDGENQRRSSKCSWQVQLWERQVKLAEVRGFLSWNGHLAFCKVFETRRVSSFCRGWVLQNVQNGDSEIEIERSGPGFDLGQTSIEVST